MPQQKLKIGWFSFSCCEDSTIMFTELLNDHLDWLPMLEFKHARVLQSHNVLEDIDVAFVEGAITSMEEEEQVKKIRSVAKRIVAIGSCASTGLPSGQRNQFDDDTKASIQFLLDRFKQADTVKSLSEVITVDDKIFGCPMDEKKFLEILNKYLKKFGVIS